MIATRDFTRYGHETDVRLPRQTVTFKHHMPRESQPAIFATTHWSVVVAAQQSDTQSLAALDRLCRAYWYPLYAFARRLGHSPEDASDLTQDFFAQLLAHGAIAKA